MNVKRLIISFQTSAPGYAGNGGSSSYACHLDSILNRDDEQQIEEVEDRIDEPVDDEDIEQATYELSKNGIDDKKEEESIENYREDDSEENYDDGNQDFSQIEEDFKMIDSDIEK